MGDSRLNEHNPGEAEKYLKQMADDIHHMRELMEIMALDTLKTRVATEFNACIQFTDDGRLEVFDRSRLPRLRRGKQ